MFPETLCSLSASYAKLYQRKNSSEEYFHSGNKALAVQSRHMSLHSSGIADDNAGCYRKLARNLQHEMVGN